MSTPAVQAAHDFHQVMNAIVSGYGRILEGMARENVQLRAELAASKADLTKANGLFVELENESSKKATRVRELEDQVKNRNEELTEARLEIDGLREELEILRAKKK